MSEKRKQVLLARGGSGNVGVEAFNEEKVLLPARRDNEGRFSGPPHAPRGHNHPHASLLN